MEIDLIGVPLDFGAGRRGVDMGPSAIRYAGLRQGLESLGYVVNDRGNLAVPLLETCEQGNPRLKYLDPIVSVAARVAGLRRRTRYATSACRWCWVETTAWRSVR